MAGYANCLRAVAQAAGRELTDEEVSKIYERVHKAALDLKAGRLTAEDIAAGRKVEALAGQGSDALVRAAAERAAADLVAEAAKIERQAELQVLKAAARGEEQGLQIQAGVKPLDALGNLIARNYKGKVNLESVEQRVSGVTKDLLRKLMPTWNALGDDFLGFFQDRQQLLLLVRELRGEDTGNATAKAGAKAFHEVAEAARKAFNDAGGDVGKLDDWGMPQHHSQEKVAAAGREVWVDRILPRLDRSRYVDDLGNPWSDAQLRDFLGEAWWTISTNGHATREAGGARGAGKRANRHAESRQIHFKDAESVIGYWGEFGERTAAEILLNHVETMARDIAFIEKFGPNPNITYATLRTEALRAATIAEPKKTQSLEGQAAKLDNLFDYAAGRSKASANSTLSGIADGIAHLNVAGKLGGAVFASLFGDKPMMEAVSHLNDLPALQRWRTELSLFNPANAEDRRLLQRQGLMLDAVRSGLQRFYEGLGSSGSTTGKLANGVMRITGMQAINDIRKASFGLSLMSAIGEEIRAGRDFANLAESDIRTLRQYGITEADWKVWKLAPLEDVGSGNTHALTPEAIARISDANLRRLFEPEVRKAQDKLGEQIAELMGRNAEEGRRLDTRMAEIRKAEARAAERLNKYMTSKDAQVRSAAEILQARQELVRAQLAAVEAEAFLEKHLAQDNVRADLAQLADDVLVGRDPDVAAAAAERRMTRRQGEAAGPRVPEAARTAERLGVERGKAQRRVAEMQDRIRELEHKADVAVKNKYEELRGDVQKVIDDADAWYEASAERTKRRDFVIDRLLGEASEAEKKTLDGARRDAIVKLLGAVNTESEFAIVTPGWRERAAFYADLQRGTAKGEVVRSILQFKSFPWAMFQRSMDLVANADGPASKAAMTAYLVTSTTLAGAMLMQTREMLSGKDPRAMADQDWWKFWGAAFLQGGALGIYGDFLYSANQNRYGSGILENMAGPTVGPLLEIGLTQPLNAAAKAMEGKETHLAAQTLQDLKGFVPGGNIWYAKAALDHLIFQQVFEAMSPGYLASVRSRTLKEYRQDWWWQPGALTPERGPELGRAISR
jgi:hypothetical protein